MCNFSYSEFDFARLVLVFGITLNIGFITSYFSGFNFSIELILTLCGCAFIPKLIPLLSKFIFLSYLFFIRMHILWTYCVGNRSIFKKAIRKIN